MAIAVRSEIVLNDLSLSFAPALDAAHAAASVMELARALAPLIDDNLVIPLIRGQISLSEAQIQLANGESWLVGQWLLDWSEDREEKSFLSTLETKVPVEKDARLSEALEDALLVSEYRAGSETGPNCFAVGFALLTGGLLASLRFSEVWSTTELRTYVYKDGGLVQTAVVDQVSHEQQCTELSERIRGKFVAAISNAKEIWHVRNEAFPDISFSSAVEGQLKDIQATELRPLLSRLVAMNCTARTWRRESAEESPRYEFAWFPESESTMSNPDYRQARSFALPAGGEAIFERHVRVSRSHRIHFIEDAANKTFIIGYIGKHLPTTQFGH